MSTYDWATLPQALIYFWLPVAVIAGGIGVLVWLAVSDPHDDEYPRHTLPDDEEEESKKK